VDKTYALSFVKNIEKEGVEINHYYIFWNDLTGFSLDEEVDPRKTNFQFTLKYAEFYLFKIIIYMIFRLI